jgi:hypothetical protein
MRASLDVNIPNYASDIVTTTEIVNSLSAFGQWKIRGLTNEVTLQRASSWPMLQGQ